MTHHENGFTLFGGIDRLSQTEIGFCHVPLNMERISLLNPLVVHPPSLWRCHRSTAVKV